MHDVLTPHQTAIAQRVIAQEGAKRTHLVVSLSGAHAYGFPSPDSDLDLKAIHISPTRAVLGLFNEPKPGDRLEVIEGIEIDYSSNELQLVLKGVLTGNGNYLERVLGHLQPYADASLAELKPLVKACMSRQLHRHYSGFARGLFHEWELTGFSSVKKLLYVVRTTMTGLHALRTGELVTDVSALIDDYRLTGVDVLIAQKRRGERSDLPSELATEWRARIDSFFTRLDDALPSSLLPAEPAADAVNALEAWLIEVRRRRL